MSSSAGAAFADKTDLVLYLDSARKAALCAGHYLQKRSNLCVVAN